MSVSDCQGCRECASMAAELNEPIVCGECGTMNGLRHGVQADENGALNVALSEGDVVARLLDAAGAESGVTFAQDGEAVAAFKKTSSPAWTRSSGGRHRASR